MVLCGEPNCNVEFNNGRTRRRHVHKVHRALPYICTSCNNEPFLSQDALNQHCNTGHMKFRAKRKRKSKKAKKLDTMFKLSTDQHCNDGHMSLRAKGKRLDRMFELSTERELNNFIASTVQANSEYLRACGQTVDKLVQIVQNNLPSRLQPRRVIKGGSLCKGTAVFGKSDVDLDVMLTRYTNVKTLVDDMPSLLDELGRYLGQHGNIQVTGSTHRCVQLKFVENGYTIEADVLPAVDLLSENTPTEVFAKMGRETSRMQGFYSPSLAPLQRELFEKVPTKVKSLIRLLKYWKKDVLQASDTRVKWPASYALELVALDTWRQLGADDTFNMLGALKKVLLNLSQHQNFRISFPRYGRVTSFYNIDDYKINHGSPYIMDPCNPFNNVYYKGGYDWEKTAEKAREWRRQPLFQ